MNITRIPSHSALALAAALAASVLTACGGGGDGGSSADALSDSEAQGYAADSATMPVAAASAVDSSIASASDAIAGATANGMQQTQRVQAEAATPSTVGCAMSGSVTYTGDTNNNGQFDKGESYSVTFNSCKGVDGNVLNGTASITVTDKTSTSLSITHQTTGLQITSPAGYTWTHNGTTTVTRSATTNSIGGIDYSTHITSSQSSTLTTSMNSYSASYTLNSLDWTVTRSFDGNGALNSRSHQGTVSIDASTPRRPNATLQITATGSTLGIGSDGMVHSGSFSVATRRNTISVTVANNTMTINLDVGSDGSVDRTWTVTSYANEAG